MPISFVSKLFPSLGQNPNSLSSPFDFQMMTSRGCCIVITFVSCFRCNVYVCYNILYHCHNFLQLNFVRKRKWLACDFWFELSTLSLLSSARLTHSEFWLWFLSLWAKEYCSHFCSNWPVTSARIHFPILSFLPIQQKLIYPPKK